MLSPTRLLALCALAGLAPWAAGVAQADLGRDGDIDLASQRGDDDDPPEPEEEEPLEVSIEYITGIEYRRGQGVPADILELDGKKVTITGYMAIGTEEGSAVFELVPESCECGRSKVQHFIEVTIEDGGVTYQPGRIDLVGIFGAGEVKEDGFITSIYRLKLEIAP
ncbi:MAG: hypothetical protein ACI8QC_002070 [Planctomycetota bacterium]|jgi:hypothetical protein